MNQCSTNFSPAKIQCLLKERGITQKMIAVELCVSEMAVSDVINFRMVSQKLMREIARRIDADPKAVFAWYFCQERPRRPPRRT